MTIWSILQLFGIFFGHLVYFTAIWYILHTAIWYILWPSGIHIYVHFSILQPFGIFSDHLLYIFYGHLMHFSRSGILYQEKSGSPALKSKSDA
jgi:hypothetical protein